MPPTAAFNGQVSRWRIEGTLSVEDAGPIVFLTGGDLLFPLNGTYVEPGVVCRDVVEGEVPVVTTFDPPSTDPNNLTSAFDVVYNCQDSFGKPAVEVRRGVTVGGPDTDPPVIILDPCTTEPGIDCSLDGSAGAGIVNRVTLLTGKTYVDAGGTCFDNADFNISLGAAGPLPEFTSSPFPATVDTSVGGVNHTITFTCKDSTGNLTTVDRTVRVRDDNIPPVISLGTQSQDVKLTAGSAPPDLALGITCKDTNPVDLGVNDITNAGGNVGLDFSPTSVDTNTAGTTQVVYSCLDEAGNAADQVTRTFDVVSGETFEIISMTISDIDGDKIAGCFKFDTFNPVTCANAHRFSSDGSAVSGFADPANATLPGSGTDLDGDGNPVGVLFGEYQNGGGKLMGGEITPGFKFSGFPFVPITFNPNAINASSPSLNVPKGYVTVTGPDSAVLTFDSLPWGGAYTTVSNNVFDLSPDTGTLTTEILSVNDDDDGITRTVNYIADWKHVIKRSETSSLDSFNNFLANFRIEGVITLNSTPVVLNSPPFINEIRVTQPADQQTTSIIVKNGGLFAAEVDATDKENGVLSYDWSKSDVVPVGSATSASVAFDPSSIQQNAGGVVTLRVTVTDDADEPLSASREYTLRVINELPKLGPGDSDGDGISDAIEGIGDNDLDLIPNYLDPIDGITEPTRNRRDYADPAAGDVVTDTGKLRLGDTAFRAGKSVFIVTEGDIGVQDRLNSVDGIGHSGGGIYDFEVSGLPLGGTVRIVLPQAKPLPKIPVYRKFTSDRGWFEFSTAGGNKLASTMKVNGSCPAPDDLVYDDNLGLVEGDDCVRLTIVDGSAMDGDGKTNGVILDPGTGAGNGPVPVDDSGGGGCTISPSRHSTALRVDLWLLGILLAGFGIFRNRRRLGR